MPNTAQSIFIDAPVGEVFEFVADYRNIVRFEKHFSKVERQPGPAYGTGMVLDCRGRFRGVPVRVKLRVIEFVENRRIVSQSIAGLKSLLEWDFSEEDGGTRAKLFANYGWPFPLIPKHLKDSIREEIDEMTADSLRELKRLIEAKRVKPQIAEQVE